MLEVSIPNLTSVGKCVSSDFNKPRQIPISYFVLLHSNYKDDHKKLYEGFTFLLGTVQFFVELIVFQSKNNFPKSIN